MSSKQEKSEKSDTSKTSNSKKMSFSLNNPNDPKPSNTDKGLIALVDDDDEFEEFPVDAGHIEPAEEEEDGDEKDTIWEDNWEDETVGEDFSVELKAELEKMGSKVVI